MLIDQSSFDPEDFCYEKACFHTDRITGGDRDHRGPHRLAFASGPGRSRGRPAYTVHQQPQVIRHRFARLSRRVERPPAVRLHLPVQFPDASRPAALHGATGVIQPMPILQRRWQDTQRLDGSELDRRANEVGRFPGSSVFRCKTRQKAPSGPWQSGGSARSSSPSPPTPGSSPRSSDSTNSPPTSDRTSAS
jgi:hypothetical protein